jgi:hypothetical protein
MENAVQGTSGLFKDADLFPHILKIGRRREELI